MNSHYDVIIVGAGIAGLTSSAYLVKDGYSVLLVEKEQKIGGMLGAFAIDGHIVDQGARGIIDSGIFTPMVKQLGLDIELVPNPIRISVGNYSVDLKESSSIDDYGAMLARLYPDHQHEITVIIAKIKRVMGYMDVLYGIENPLFLPQPYDYRYLALTLLPWSIKMVSNIRQAMKLMDPINDYLRTITTSEALINIITQHFFADTPTFFALSYFSLYLDYLYPKGSTQAVVDRMAEFIAKHNGHIMTGQEAVRIDPAERRLWLKSGGSYTYNQMIWAADLNVLYRCLNAELWPDSQLKEKVREKQTFLSSKKGADSVLSVYMIVDQSPEVFRDISGPHCFYTPSTQGLSGISLSDLRDDQGRFVDEPATIFSWLEGYVANNTFEISIPALRDPSLSPPGQCALIVSFLFDYNLTKHIAARGTYEQFKLKMADLTIRNLEWYFTGLSKHVRKTVVTTPLTIANTTYSTEGSLSGWSFTNQPFPAEYRFLRVSKSVLTPVDTIKQAGQWAFNPAGAPVSMLTAKLAADAVAKDLRKLRKKG